MVIIASHTAGGNLTVFLPRKHPRLCPRSLTTWMAAKLSSSYYNHLITEAPPCALPVFFFFFLLLYLQDCCETCCITSKVILMRECTGITCCSKWCPHDNGRAEVDQTGEHLIRKKNTKKKLLCSCLYRSLFHECFYQKGLAGVSVSERGIRKEVDLRSLSRSPGRNSNKQSWSQAVWFKNKHSGDARRGKAHGVYVRLEHTDETKKGVWGRDWTLNL